jgi:hypothetical protein
MKPEYDAFLVGRTRATWMILTVVLLSVLAVYDALRTPTRFKDVPGTLVNGKHFVNEVVPLDGFDYTDCVFEHVTLEYKGTRPIQLRDNTFVSPFRIKLDDPSLLMVAALAEGLGTYPVEVLGPDDKPMSQITKPTIRPRGSLF